MWASALKGALAMQLLWSQRDRSGGSSHPGCQMLARKG